MAGIRQAQKRLSREKILEAASRRLRAQGPDRVGIQAVMQEAGLTHGAFYAHFQNKEQLAVAAFEHAIETSQPPWFAAAEDCGTFEERLSVLARRYLTPEHREHRESGCAIAALASDVVGASPGLQASYSRAVEDTVQKIANGDAEYVDAAIEFLAAITGALSLARNTSDAELSDRILDVCLSRYSLT